VVVDSLSSRQVNPTTPVAGGAQIFKTKSTKYVI